MDDKEYTKGYTSRIESLKKKLYSRQRKPVSSRTYIPQQKEHYVPGDWTNNDTGEHDGISEGDLGNLNAQNISNKMKKKGLFLNKALIVAIIFFILAAVYAFFTLTGGGGVISSKNIDIVVSGPISIAAGDVLSLQIDVRNNNNVELELTDLLIEYPDGTRASDDLSKELKRYRKSLGNIASGKNAEQVIESVLFGEEGEKKVISIGVEYRVLGSNAIFFTDREYKVEIVSSPVSMIIDSPSNISSGQDLEFEVKISANSSNTVNNILLSVEYPFGFEFRSANITPSFDDSIWELGSLAPGKTRTIKITGVLLGQDAEERTFRFAVGIPSEFDEKVIGTPFLTHSNSILIQRPFISLNLALNGSTREEYIGNVGSIIRGDVSWQNNLPSKASNVSIEIKLKGDVLNRGSINSSNGFYRSTDDTIIWDGRSLPTLSSLDAGERGTTSFSFSPSDISSLAGNNTDPIITLVANIFADSFDDSGLPKRIVTTVERTINVSSAIDITARAVHFSGPFINNGPMPPKANSETTYTVIWSVSNVLNDVTGAKVTATLPTYVRWMGVVSPASSDVVYNPVGGQVTWDIGNIERGVGYNTPAEEMAFQIALTPSTSQIGDSPILLNNIELEVQDTVTDARLIDDWSHLTTRIESDPQYASSQGFVIGE